jgi:hypothetical protein
MHKQAQIGLPSTGSMKAHAGLADLPPASVVVATLLLDNHLERNTSSSAPPLRSFTTACQQETAYRGTTPAALHDDLCMAHQNIRIQDSGGLFAWLSSYRLVVPPTVVLVNHHGAGRCAVAFLLDDHLVDRSTPPPPLIRMYDRILVLRNHCHSRSPGDARGDARQSPRWRELRNRAAGRPPPAT